MHSLAVRWLPLDERSLWNINRMVAGRIIVLAFLMPDIGWKNLTYDLVPYIHFRNGVRGRNKFWDNFFNDLLERFTLNSSFLFSLSEKTNKEFNTNHYVAFKYVRYCNWRNLTNQNNFQIKWVRFVQRRYPTTGKIRKKCSCGGKVLERRCTFFVECI